MASEPGRRVYRAASAIIVSGASAVVAVLLLGDAFLRAGVVTGLLLAPWVLLVVWGVYVVAYVSCVRTDATGVQVQNLLRIVDVPWQQITDIDLRWQLQLHLGDGGVVRSFGGPATGRAAPRPGADRPGGRSSAAERDLELIRDEWQSALREGRGDAEVRRRWDVWALVALAVLLLWALIAYLVGGRPF